MDITPDLDDILGFSFKDKTLLEQVFIHRSYLNEHRDCPISHNERLEFLGDAVLELVVTEYLYQTYPNPEGELTTWRSALVRGEQLAKIAQDFKIPENLKLSKGEERSGGREKGYLLANAFEALIGAVYLDQGYEVVKTLIHQAVLSKLDSILTEKSYIDPKSRLQEYTQDSLGITPSYEVVSEEGPDHAKTFIVQVLVGKDVWGQGEGNSKQAAQIAAAANAWEKKNKE